MAHRLFFVASLILFVVAGGACMAQGGGAQGYSKKEVMAPMRDGVKLFTRIYTPIKSAGPLPILLMRSPYADWNIGVISPDKDPYVRNLAAEEYIFVYHNIREKQQSEGEFIMEGPMEKKK